MFLTILEDVRSTLENSIVGEFGDQVSKIFENLYNMVEALDPVSQIGVLVVGGIIAILGTFSLIKKLTKLIIIVVVIWAIWTYLV